MPRGIESYRAENAPFLLLQGYPNTGKTTAIEGLVRAGYRVHYADVGRQAESLMDAMADLPHEYVAEHFWWVPIVSGVTLSEASTLRPVDDTHATWATIRRLCSQRWTDGVEKAPFYPRDNASDESRAYWNDRAVLVLDCLSDLERFAYAEGRLRDLNRAGKGGPSLDTWIGSMEDITPGSTVLMDLLRMLKYLCTPKRPFSIIVLAHCDSAKIKVKRHLTEAEIAAITENEAMIETYLGQDHTSVRKAMAMTVETLPKYPLGIAKKDHKSIVGLFDRIYGTYRDEDDDQCYIYTREHPEHVVVRGCDLAHRLPKRLPNRTGLATILDHHFGRAVTP